MAALLLCFVFYQAAPNVVTTSPASSAIDCQNAEGPTSNGQTSSDRIAWLFPSLARGSYWHPLFSQFSQQYPNTTIYTGEWPGFAAGFEDDFSVEVVGETKILHTSKADNGYSRTFIVPSWEIVPKLLAAKPDIIFTSAFSLWTAIALLFKFFYGTRVIVLFDGVSPGVDHLNSGFRVFPRRLMSKCINAFITNSKAGKKYLVEVVRANSDRVYVQPYLVPDMSALNRNSPDNSPNNKTSLSKLSKASLSKASLSKALPSNEKNNKPVFFFIGQIVPRKGLAYLIKACGLLKQQGYHFTLLIIGEGKERSALEALARQHHLEDDIQWAGRVNYHQLGAYFEQADIFVFPTLEDIWGMVVPEAMTFGKPVLCSKWAGATEIVEDGNSGCIFDPRDVDQLAELMSRFIEQPDLIDEMGDRAKQLAANLTPQKAATFFCKLTATI